jgi:hypothetical protein
VPKIPGIPHLLAVRALEKAGFRIVREAKHIVISNGRRILTILVTIPSMHTPWAVSPKTLARQLRSSESSSEEERTLRGSKVKLRAFRLAACCDQGCWNRRC